MHTYTYTPCICIHVSSYICIFLYVCIRIGKLCVMHLCALYNSVYTHLQIDVYVCMYFALNRISCVYEFVENTFMLKTPAADWPRTGYGCGIGIVVVSPSQPQSAAADMPAADGSLRVLVFLRRQMQDWLGSHNVQCALNHLLF